MSDSLTPSERSMRARMAVHRSWANTENPAARTAKAREANLSRFDREVDPDGILPPAERARRAAHARKAYYTELAFKSAKARRAKAKTSTPDDLSEAS